MSIVAVLTVGLVDGEVRSQSQILTEELCCIQSYSTDCGTGGGAGNVPLTDGGLVEEQQATATHCHLQETRS